MVNRADVDLVFRWQGVRPNIVQAECGIAAGVGRCSAGAFARADHRSCQFRRKIARGVTAVRHALHKKPDRSAYIELRGPA
jgi:hypothetical protein